MWSGSVRTAHRGFTSAGESAPRPRELFRWLFTLTTKTHVPFPAWTRPAFTSSQQLVRPPPASRPGNVCSPGAAADGDQVAPEPSLCSAKQPGLLPSVAPRSFRTHQSFSWLFSDPPIDQRAPEPAPGSQQRPTRAKHRGNHLSAPAGDSPVPGPRVARQGRVQLSTHHNPQTFVRVPAPPAASLPCQHGRTAAVLCS